MIEIAAPICYRTCPVYQPGTSAPMFPIEVPTVVSIIILLVVVVSIIMVIDIYASRGRGRSR